MDTWTFMGLFIYILLSKWEFYDCIPQKGNSQQIKTKRLNTMTS